MEILLRTRVLKGGESAIARIGKKQEWMSNAGAMTRKET